MNRTKSLALALAVCLLLCGCGSDTAVYVQSVSNVSGMGGIAPGDRFTGMVVSENVTEIEKDSEQTVKELLVREGDDVKKDQPLFSYDTEELQLTLDKQTLELEQLQLSIESYKSQIASLERERAGTSGTTKLQYTLEIQTAQVEMKEAELKIAAKEKEVTKSEDLLANATVLSPVDGRIQAISEDGEMSDTGQALPYITIQQVGSYRIKGMLGELQRGGIQEGDRVKILSRTNSSDTWSGTVTLVDYESPTQGSDSDGYYGGNSDSMSNASRYPFYVELDSTEGLLLGQHIYMELETQEGEVQGLPISSAFIAFEEDGTSYVWAEKGGRLEKRPVTLGEYDPMTDTYPVTEGLTESDYIAFPDPEVCREGASTTHDQPAQTEPAAPEAEVFQ